ncbi:MAG: hypothetical protein KatS3mg102_2418 [Planctomycetota bacterium]|nr:MAG: hypothetical protein KatS3mg102_2418 [Planctomycetota bacterium]
MAGSERWRVPLFDFGARAYDWLTAQPLWREQIARVLAYAPAGPAPRLLDLGCGPGVSTFVLAERLGPQAELLGIDVAPKMIARARHHHVRHYGHLRRVRFAVADATRLPLRDRSIDLAVGHSFLYLVPDRLRVLAEVRRVLVRGGTLVLMEPHAAGSLLRAARAGAARAHLLWEQPSAAFRFVASMVAWRLLSGTLGRLVPAEVEALFLAAGFREIHCSPTLGGLGLHCVGRT